MKKGTKKLMSLILAVLMIFSLGLTACQDVSKVDADKTALVAAITLAESKVEIEYTPVSFSAMKSKLTIAKAVNADATATQSDVDSAKTALTTAVTALVIKAADKTALNASIAAAEAKVESHYTPASWVAMTAKLTAAKATKDSAAATQSNVDTAKTALDNAVAALVEKEAVVVFTPPATQFVLTNDIVKFRADREVSEVSQSLQKLVTATVDGEPTDVIVSGKGTLVRDAVTGLYPLGEHEITYAISTGATYTYKINVVDGRAVDYYFYGKNSSIYATPDTVGGNINYKGGEGIRVAENMFFKLEGDITELPEELTYAAKLKDFDDAFAVQNLTNNSLTFNVNDNAGVHIHMDASGKVKMMFEGVEAKLWTETGVGTMTGSVFGTTEKTLAPGDIYFVVGNTATGNWYSDFGTPQTEKHWKDGRFPARNTVGAGNSSGGARGAGNVAKIIKGTDSAAPITVTSAYTNQLPYIFSGGSDIKVAKGVAKPTDAVLLTDISFYDDGGVWGTDTVVSNEKISINTAAVNTAVAGTYDIVYTVVDDTDAGKNTTFARKIIVSDVPASKFISYTNKDGQLQYLTEADAVAVYNKADAASTGKIGIYSAEYFNANKATAASFVGCNFGVYVVIDSNGNFVKSYYNTNMIDATNPTGGKIEGGLGDARAEALAKETLNSGEYIMFFQQDGTVVKVRAFAVALRDSFKSRIGSGKISIIDVDGCSTSYSISYVSGANTVVMKPRTYKYNAASYNAANADTWIYDNKYIAKDFAGFGWGYYIKVDGTGKIIELYDGANAATIYNAANPNGIDAASGNANILKNFDFATLADGEKIIIFPHNGHIAAGDNKPTPTSFASAITALVKGETTFNANNITFTFANIVS